MARSRHRGGTLLRPSGGKRGRVRFAAEVDTVPQVLRDIDVDPRDLRIVGEKVIDERLRDLLDLLDRVQLRKREYGVLNGVRGQNIGVLAGGVTLLEVSLELDADRQLLECMPIRQARDLN